MCFGPNPSCQETNALGLVARADDPISFAVSSADQMIPVARRVSGAVSDALFVAGPMQNLKAGKTKLLADFRGKNAAAKRKRIYLDGSVTSIASQVVKDNLRLVGDYKHLGTWIQIRQKHDKDYRTKFAAANDVTRYRSQIFGNKKIAAWNPRQSGRLHLSSIAFFACIICVLDYGSQALHWEQAYVFAEQDLLPSDQVLTVSNAVSGAFGPKGGGCFSGPWRKLKEDGGN